MESSRPASRHRNVAPLKDPNSEIRLLYIHNGSFEDRIKCDITCHPLKSAPIFRAISYAWGQKQSGQDVYVGGNRWVVRENCYYALQQARHFHPDSYLWIDSICIDQEDSEEKSAQVAIMGEIYAQAVEVLACVGPADESSEYIQQKLPIIDKIIQDFPEDWYDYGIEQARAYWNPPGGEDAVIRLADHWDVFCDRPYFHRLWVVQELYEAKHSFKILCGMTLLSWDKLVDLQWALYSCFNLLHDAPTARGSCSEAIKDLDGLLDMHDDKAFEFYYFMISVCNLDCEDPRDRIYGTLRLIDWDRVGIPRPVPDYNISNFDLALQIMNHLHFYDPDFSQISWLARTLELDSSRLTEDDEEDDDAGQIGSREPSVLSSTSISGAARIERDSHGQLNAALIPSSRKTLKSEQLVNIVPTRAGMGPYHIFTDGDLAALVGPDVHPGDILVETSNVGLLVLRPQDELTFRLTGKGFLLNGYAMKQSSDWKCGCWSDQAGPLYKFEFVKLSFETSARKALTYASHCWDDDLESCSRRMALDLPLLGSCIRDVSAEKWEPHRSIRRVEGSCPEHDAKTCAGLRRHGVMFSAASGCGAYVKVSR